MFCHVYYKIFVTIHCGEKFRSVYVSKCNISCMLVLVPNMALYCDSFLMSNMIRCNIYASTMDYDYTFCFIQTKYVRKTSLKMP